MTLLYILTLTNTALIVGLYMDVRTYRRKLATWRPDYGTPGVLRGRRKADS